MPRASIVIPAYNVEKTLSATLSAALGQTAKDHEVIVVDDGSTDSTHAVAQSFACDRLRIIRQANRGLAGARNTGIHAARGDYIGFCDSDDLWRPNKLAMHIEHLDARPEVGLSFSGSELISEDGQALGLFQTPRLIRVDAAHVFKRNPVGNGSSPVLRRAALDAIAFRPHDEFHRNWWFDETFRQSEDIETWLRLALTTDWEIAGVPGALTAYRINQAGLSANTARQLQAWERMVAKLTPLAPAFFEKHAPAARAYQLRYLARRAVSDRDGRRAWRLFRQSLAQSMRPLVEETGKTLVTGAAAGVLTTLGPRAATRIEAALRRKHNQGA